MEPEVNLGLFIDGRVVSDGRRSEIRNPANISEVVGTVVDAEPVQAVEAVEAAARALPEWSSLGVGDRAAILLDAAAHLERGTGPAALLTREQGKVLWESEFSVGFLPMVLRFAAEQAAEVLADQVLVDDELGRILMRQRPVGIVAAISPWNWPVALSATKVGPALAMGNTVVLKPPSTAPLAVTVLMQELARLLPPGVLNVVTGRGSTVGPALSGHPLVRKVAFTGSTDVGRGVMKDAADTVKNLTLELGGNDAAVILDDVTVDEDLAGNIISGAFTTSGQLCFAIKRVYAPEALAGDLIDALVAVLESYVVGNGLAPDVTMGPVNNGPQKQFVEELVDEAGRRGGKVRQCGRFQDGIDPSDGHFLLPAIVSDLDDDARLVREEQFGPALPVLVYSDESDVLRRVNDSEFGLCSSVWTADEGRGERFARRIEAGATFINSHGLFSIDPHAPFGGVKQSGLGREMARLGLEAYCEGHVISRRHL